EKPQVLFSCLYQDVWYMPGGKSYMAQFLNDANGSYQWQNNTNTGSISLSFEEIILKSSQNDIWINPEAETVKDLLTKDNRYKLFLPSLILGLYNNTLHTTPQGGNDYWESGVVNPHLILLDFAKMLHPKNFEKEAFN